MSAETASHRGKIAHRITVKGTVQGVGFRPFIYRIASKNNITGEVSNTPAGVYILAEGDKREIGEFIHEITENAPPLARIDAINIESVPVTGFDNFLIVASQNVAEREVILPPDVSICPDCEREIFDSGNPRYRYFLNNCTNCGPRYSIIRILPYDRPATAMAPFPLCETCQKEYEDPHNRRFHAEATSCPVCGPALNLTSATGQKIVTTDPLSWIAEKIQNGSIVAIQGVGGFHLVCDALNEETVQLLRQRKNRPAKPFAVMVKDREMAEEYGQFSEHSRTLIGDIRRPVVIVPDRGGCCPAVTGGLEKIGLFLPYTPLHLILFQILDRPIVATSANISDEPIITTAGALRKRLGAVVDYILEFNREIINGCDDSVVTTAGSATLMLRCARGYAPTSITLPEHLQKKVLAVGADLKNTIAIGQKNTAILSPHIGDLRTISAEEYFSRTVETFYRLYDFIPELIVCDKHPSYASSCWAQRQGIPNIRVQHHYAHALSGMVACGLGIDSEILSICWDGTGFGDDGTIWGGEFLECSFRGFQRVASFKPFPLLGSEKAVKEPRRVALSLLFNLCGTDIEDHPSPAVQSFDSAELEMLRHMFKKRLNSPLTSSVGRFFDAAASLFDICQILSYEGESGLLMEQYYAADSSFAYPFVFDGKHIDCSQAIEQMAFEKDKVKGVSGFINMLVNIIIEVMRVKGHREALLTGGVFQNSRLVEKLLLTAHRSGIKFYIPAEVPVNDGGISLGQLAFALKNF